MKDEGEEKREKDMRKERRKKEKKRRNNGGRGEEGGDDSLWNDGEWGDKQNEAIFPLHSFSRRTLHGGQAWRWRNIVK
jgi:hypothetical protein